MSELDDILTNNAATLFVMGQDWTKGDGSASKVDEVADKAKEQVKKLMLELIDESMPQGTYHVNTEVLQQKVAEL